MSKAASPAGPEENAVRAPAEERARFESTYACILAFNDGTSIAKVVRKALGHCGNVIVCDDGSTDGTSDEARRAGAHVIRHDTSLGKGKSMSDLVNEVILRSPSGFVLLEREGFNHVDDIPAVLEPIMRDQADIAVGMSATGGAAPVDAGVTAMNSKGLFTLYREGFFSDKGTSPQTAIAAASGLRVRAVTLGIIEARLAAARDRRGSLSNRSGGGGGISRFISAQRDFLAVGIPAIAFTAVGAFLLTSFLIAYNYTGQISVPQGVRGVIGLISIVFGMGFMVAYAVAYYSKLASQGKKA